MPSNTSGLTTEEENWSMMIETQRNRLDLHLGAGCGADIYGYSMMPVVFERDSLE
jgi:hypothetical protein